jgi:D-serine deaminase-like pyridoxal phosphate-dependent protein
MKKEDLQTPAILLDLDKFEKNIKNYQTTADNHKKELWPMIKTHKSTEIVQMQIKAGATGVLCGTLDEAEACAQAGIQPVMYAYPIASKESISRVIELTNTCDFILRLDDLDGASIINQAAMEANVQISYTMVIDSGLHRFGVHPKKAVEFAKALEPMSGLRFRGISTHTGQVYGCQSKDQVSVCIEAENQAIQEAVENLRQAGYNLELITAGSTPTFLAELGNPYINVVHPGNYVFNDVIQIALDVAQEEDCALSVLATVISHPREDLYIIDAGAKCLGLDQGAHGNQAIVGFGRVKGHPELIIHALSEEVGKIHAKGQTTLKVGDTVEIIPNHACSTANLTSYYHCIRKGRFEGVIEVDIRGNSKAQIS